VQRLEADPEGTVGGAVHDDLCLASYRGDRWHIEAEG
jgi:hypothetical protein